MLLSSHSSATLGCTGVDRGPGSLQRLLRLPHCCKWLCPRMPQPLSFSCFIPAWGSEEEKTDWTELSQEQSKPSRSSWADYLLFLFTNDNMTFSVSHLKKKSKLGAEQHGAALAFWACVLSLLPGGVKHNHCLLLMVFCFLKDWILHPGFQKPSSQCSALACSSEYRGGSKTPVWESAQGDCYSFYTQSCRRLWSIVF